MRLQVEIATASCIAGRRELAQEALGRAVEQREPLAHGQGRGLVRGAERRAARSPRDRLALGLGVPRRSSELGELAEVALDARQLARP